MYKLFNEIPSIIKCNTGLEKDLSEYFKNYTYDKKFSGKF